MSHKFCKNAARTSFLVMSFSLSQGLFATEQSPSSPAAVASSSSRSLADQVEQLSGGSTGEKFYVVHSQRSGNVGVYDLAVGAGVNTTGDVNIQSTDTMIRAKYHANNHMFVSLAASQVKNQFNASAQRRISEDQIFPDVGFVTSRSDLSFGYNLIYGKARLTKDAVFYFDQYVALGAGLIDQTDTRNSVVTPAMVADLGISFWFGGRVSLAVGAKTYRFQETRIASRGTANHVIGYGNLGMLLGGAG